MPQSLKRVEAANALPFTTYRTRFFPSPLDPVTIPSIPPLSYEIRLEAWSSLTSDEFSACFNLIASTSADAYAASSVGWSPAKKRKEMQLPDLRYLLVLAPSEDNNKKVEGFVSFMLTYEDGHEVVYCYEIHLSDRMRARGIGRHLVQLVEEAGIMAGMEKSMLTVFVENEAARRFYDRLGYRVDDYSPGPRKLRNGTIKEPTYLILSKTLVNAENRER